MRKKLLLIFVIAMSFILSNIGVLAAENVSIYVENISVGINQDIQVPIKINGNGGLCGATITVNYDSNLILSDVVKGEALSTLVMTKPGNMSLNPVNIVYDGMEEDKTNGIIAYLCFEPVNSAGVYNISISYEDGSIVDGALQPIQVELVNGKVTVTASDSGNNEDDKDDENDDVVSHNAPIITIGNVIANSNENIDVPIYISQNTGICGTTITFSYDSSLTLTGITRGEALPSLVMTKPGNLSFNPFNLVFDGMEEDKTNGIVVTLSFKAPKENGTYNITATYEDGDIVNGLLQPVDVLIKNGSITVGAKNIEVTVGNNTITLPNITETNGDVYIAFYKNSEQMTSVRRFNLSDTNIAVSADTNADYAKVFCWTDDLTPLCEAKIIKIK